jgi:hypothetical protein
MSTEAHNSGHAAGQLPRNDDVTFEPTDIRTRGILYSLVYLAIAVLVSFAACIYILKYTANFAAESDTPPPPVRQGTSPALPPEPRLQGLPGHTSDPQQDLRDKIEEDTRANEKTAWIDEKAGIAQIPVKDAMKIIAEKGLPAAPAAPAAKK